MESSPPPSIAKRLWHILQVVFYMLRKGISKRKLLLDLHLLLKRGKLAGKALSNVLTAFHHPHHHTADRSFSPRDVEFSCSNTPSYAYRFNPTTKKKTRRSRRFHDEYDSFDADEIAMAFEIMNSEESDTESTAAVVSALPTPSPMLWFGRSPAMVRQLRITDSPFPIQENEAVDGVRIDQKADEFIKMFYEQLQSQQLATPDHGYRSRRRQISGRV